ncbi:hypothetical protein APHAL10511_004130 [Amanita phalloides]|nr:hypothetical protein APHAL10511_004130 [Amanita phalloides]
MIKKHLTCEAGLCRSGGQDISFAQQRWSKDARGNDYLNTEANAWHKLRHPNILEFLGTINLPCNRVGLVAPFKEINNALSYIKRFSEFQRRNIILGIAKGLRYIHHEDVIHGDLRLKSILFDDDGTPRISDFGLSRLIDHTADTTNLQYGSWSYAAPEIIIKATQDDSNIPRTAKWTTKATDVYAFSITAAEIFMGKPYRLNELNAYKLVVDKNVRPLKSDVNSPRYFSLLEACWEKKPEKRLLIEQVEKRLEYVNHAGELQNGALNDGPVH